MNDNHFPITEQERYLFGNCPCGAMSIGHRVFAMEWRFAQALSLNISKTAPSSIIGESNRRLQLQKGIAGIAVDSVRCSRKRLCALPASINLLSKAETIPPIPHSAIAIKLIWPSPASADPAMCMDSSMRPNMFGFILESRIRKRCA